MEEGGGGDEESSVLQRCSPGRKTVPESGSSLCPGTVVAEAPRQNPLAPLVSPRPRATHSGSGTGAEVTWC